METKDFIIELEKKDMKLWLNEEGGLAFKGPKNFMTDDLLNQIKERKEEIVECLKESDSLSTMKRENICNSH